MFRLRLTLYTLLLAVPVSVSAQNIADRIYHNAEIVTADEAIPAAEALAVGDGRIIGVGSLSEVVRLRGAHTEMIDLEGRTLAPGFVDAHSHLSHLGLVALSANLLCPPHGHSASIDGLVATLRRWKDEMPPVREFGLILGFGFEGCLGRHPNRADLDRVSRDLPVIAVHRAGDRSVLNSRALELAGIGPGSPAARHGRLGRAAHRRALGRVFAALDPKGFTAVIDAGQQFYASLGHTTVQDSRPHPAVLAAWPEVAAGGRLKVDVVVYPDLVRDREAPILHGPFRSAQYMNGLRVGGVMLRLDGSLNAETARLRASYLRPAAGPLTRIGAGNTFDDRQAASILAGALHNGWQVMAHASGEAAAAQFIRSVRRVKPAPNADWRPVLLQAQALPETQYRALGELGIIPAVCATLPPSHCALPPGAEIGQAEDPLAEDRPVEGAAGTETMIDANRPFTAYHDAPAARPDPLRVMAATHDLLSRAAPAADPALLRRTALKSVTLRPAWQYFEEKSKGSLTPGKLADMVILSGNPLTGGDVQVEETIKEGATIYLREEQQQEPGHPLSCIGSEACFGAMAAAAEALTGHESASERPPAGPYQ